MSKHKGKQSEKDIPPAPVFAAKAKANASLTVEDITSLLAEHKKDLAAEFKSSFESLTQKLDYINAAIGDHGARLTSLEENATTTDQRCTVLEDNYTALQKENDWLKEKVADLEGRSRRNNIRIVGLPENFGGPRPTTFFSEFLVEVFGRDTLPSPPEIDRAHRSLTAKPAPGAKPRPVLLCLHRFQIKDLIIREARKKGNLSYRGHQIRIYEDYSPDVVKLRSEYREPMAELYKRGFRPALLFPAKLRITLPGGDKKWLSSASAAKKFVEDLDMAS